MTVRAPAGDPAEVTSADDGSRDARSPSTRSAASIQPAQASFERFELKYWVPERLAPKIADFARMHLRPDPYHDVDGIQRNTSLYLETSALDFYRDHVESAPDRIKLRVRVYGEIPVGPAFFELKRKVRSVVVKKRAAVPLSFAAALIRGEHVPLSDVIHAAERHNLESFLYCMTVRRAEPAFLVTCRREAYVSEEADEVRLTIDREIAYQRTSEPRLYGAPRQWIRLAAPPGLGEGPFALVELKFGGPAPVWMGSLVRTFHMERSGFSKYVTSVEVDLEQRTFADDVVSSMWV